MGLNCIGRLDCTLLSYILSSVPTNSVAMVMMMPLAGY
jgi:hypothetical protein